MPFDITIKNNAFDAFYIRFSFLSLIFLQNIQLSRWFIMLDKIQDRMLFIKFYVSWNAENIWTCIQSKYISGDTYILKYMMHKIRKHETDSSGRLTLREFQ